MMTRLLRSLLAAFFLLAPTAANASHIFGADFFYTYLSGGNYQITLVLYGDCSGSSFPTLPTAAPAVQVFNGNSLLTNVTLQISGDPNGVEVSPVCPSEIENTSCHNGPLPGVKQFTYVGIIQLPDTSADWRFRFNGNLGTNASAGRSNGITNLVNVVNSVMAMEATLNNTQGFNSSPQFTTIPTPFYCINTSQQYNQGAVDADGDMLTYGLVPALEANNGGDVSYQTGYSASHPVAAASGSFSFDAATGQLDFIPNLVQKSVVVNKVNEYRSGVLVGTAMREMTFIVLGTCSNSPPTGNLANASNLTGGIFDISNNAVNICKNGGLLSFDFPASDPAGYNVIATINGLPSGAVANVSGNGTPTPKIHFSWNTDGFPLGAYYFYINFKNDGCALSSQQTQAFTINIVEPPVVSSTIAAETDCYHQALVSYHFAGSLPPYSVTIAEGGDTVKQFIAASNDITDSLYAGLYNVTTSIGEGCDSTFTIVINDSGTYPFGPGTDNPVFYCTGAAPQPLNATPLDSNGTIQWYNAASSPLPGPPTPSTANPGVTTYLVSQTYKTCTSLKDTVKVYVTDKPVASFTITPHDLCSGDAAQAVFTGVPGSGPYFDYNWSWDGGVATAATSDGPWSVTWAAGGTKAPVLQVLDNGCPSDVSGGDTVFVRQRPAAVFTAGDACVGQPDTILYLAGALPGQTFQWNFSGGQNLQSTDAGPFVFTYQEAGTQTVALQVSNDGCTDTATRRFRINPLPAVDVALRGGTACLGDVVQLPQSNNGTTITWEPQDLVLRNPDGSLYVRIVEPVTYTVLATNTSGCFIRDTFAYNDIQPCCTFSYPTAFTPNNDGRNDRFRVILYGNPERYDFSVFNRWGQLVFRTNDPKEGWDGTFNNQPADMGVYFYRLNAKCLTGHVEVQTGDFTLVR